MYDELVKRVRQVAEEVCEDYDVDPYNAEQRFFVIEEAADVLENVVGHWEVHGYSAPCSNCGFDTGFGNTLFERLIKQFKFCPNCGAVMR